jgi:hypothetical protein
MTEVKQRLRGIEMKEDERLRGEIKCVSGFAQQNKSKDYL